MKKFRLISLLRIRICKSLFCETTVDHSRNTITYHNVLCLSLQNFAYLSIVFSFSWGHLNSQEKLKTMLMQNFGATIKKHYGMLWYFLEWPMAGPGVTEHSRESSHQLTDKTTTRTTSIYSDKRISRKKTLKN